MSALFAWLIGTRLGRWLAGAAALALAVTVILFKAYGAGRAAERTAAAKARLEAVAKRKESDAAIDALGPADLDRRADRWMRRD